MKIVVIVFGITIVALLAILFFVPSVKNPTIQTTLQSNQLLSPDGKVRIVSPMPDAIINSPVLIQGSVTGGGWFFENSFPINVIDANGTVLGIGTAGVQPGEQWMSTGTVAFSANIRFDTPQSATGTILFSKDNPSGAPENGESFSLQVTFATGTVLGNVVLGPTCPVERIPPDPECAPRPYKTSVSISRNIETPEGFKTIQTDASGTFSVSLPTGEYIFHPQGGSILPWCNERLVEVGADETSDITISCDTGIR
jgi:hypothetical protein